jgi:hypothetical protein
LVCEWHRRSHRHSGTSMNPKFLSQKYWPIGSSLHQLWNALQAKLMFLGHSFVLSLSADWIFSCLSVSWTYDICHLH